MDSDEEDVPDGDSDEEELDLRGITILTTVKKSFEKFWIERESRRRHGLARAGEMLPPEPAQGRHAGPGETWSGQSRRKVGVSRPVLGSTNTAPSWLKTVSAASTILMFS